MADTTFKTVIKNAIEGFNDIQNLIYTNSGQLSEITVSNGSVTNVASVDAIKAALPNVTLKANSPTDITFTQSISKTSDLDGVSLSSSAGTYYITIQTTSNNSNSRTVTVTPTKAGLIKANASASKTITLKAVGETQYVNIQGAGMSVTPSVTVSPTLAQHSTPGTVTSTPTTDANAKGTYYLTMLATAPATAITMTKSNLTKGYLSAISQISASGSTTQGNTTYYLPLTAAAGSAAGVNGSNTLSASDTISWGDSNTSGISVSASATGVSQRFTVSTAGWIPTGTYGGTGGTINSGIKYITAITVPAGKTFAKVTAAGNNGNTIGGIITELELGTGTSTTVTGGKIGTFTMNAYSEITTESIKANAKVSTLENSGTISAYNGSGKIETYTNTGAITNMIGSRTIGTLGGSNVGTSQLSITNNGSSSSYKGNVTITTNTYGTVNVWNAGSDKGVQVVNHTVKVDGTQVTNANGDLTTASLVAQTGYIGGTTSGYITTTNTGFGGFYGYGNVKTNQAGWISSTNTNSNNSSTYYIVGGEAHNGYVTTAGWIAKDTSVYTLSYDSTEQCVDFVFNN